MTEDSHRELKHWLSSCGCLLLYSKFLEHGISIDVVPELDTAALKEIGVSLLGDRLRLEIAIGKLKAHDYQASFVTNSELQKLVRNTTVATVATAVAVANLGTALDDSLGTPGSEYPITSITSGPEGSPLVQQIATNSGTTSLTSALTPLSTLIPTAGPSIMTGLTVLGVETNKNVTFIFQDGSTKRVNITGCFNAQLIKRKVLKRIGIKDREDEFDSYVQITSPVTKDGKGAKEKDPKDPKDPKSPKDLKESPKFTLSCSRLFDVELVTICYSPDRLEKHRLILCTKEETPSEAALETSRKISQRQERFDQRPLRVNDKDVLSQFHIPDTTKPSPPILRNIFGQRPPSELISLNLAEYFPEAHQKDLELTVRNSVRYSVRLSRRFNLPPLALASALSTLVNRKSSLSHNKSPLVASIDLGTHAKRLPLGKTIGEMMVNNFNAIDEAKHLETDSRLSTMKPPSIYLNTSGNMNADARLVVSGVSRFGLPSLRISIQANFADLGRHSNHRYSRVELFSVDSEDENENEQDDYLNAYLDDSYSNDGASAHTGANMSAGSAVEADYFLSHHSMENSTSPNWLQGARIGAGSFGVVYLGMNPFTGELMAVKQVQLPDEKMAAKSENHKLMIEALQHEMLLLKELNHENIVRYLGLSTEAKVLNIFLEYVPGGSVLLMLLLYGPFEEPLIRNFIRQVLIGLSYLHGEDIIHRDIKGANILIDIKGTVKISDFGILKRVGSSENSEKNGVEVEKGGRRASLQGSVYWMAPEVVKQTAYTKKADIWSVGCVIIEMFTGKHPFPNFTQMQAIFKIGTNICPLIPEWCTREAKDFLMKTFEFDYEKRPDAVDLLGEPFLNTLIMSKR